MGKYAYAIIIWVFLVTLLLWLLGKESVLFFIDTPLQSLTQLTALFGGMGYLLTFFFSSRLPVLEKVKLPLDQSYKIHRLIGSIAGAGILLHITTLIANSLPSSVGISLYLLPSGTISYTLGVIAFYFILLLLFSTFYTRLPYHIWRTIHQLTGFSVLFASLHMYLINSDISTNILLRGWMVLFAFVALTSWIYKYFFYNIVAFKSQYTVVDVVREQSVLKITMVAVAHQIMAQPGQFAFFSFRSSTRAVSREAHPFTIMHANGNTITIAVKYLGDYTYKLQQVVAGDTVRVAGPYGGFGDHFINSANDAVWVAGGIGVTPFVNLLTYSQLQRSEKPVTFYYTTKEDDTTFHPVIAQQVSTLPIDYHYVMSEKQGRLSPEKIIAGLKKAPQLYDYFLCGPKGMLLSMVQYLQKIGIPSRQIHLEDFDFRDLEI